MSRFSVKKGKRLPGAEFAWDNEPGGEADTAPTPLFPKYTVPHARLLHPREQKQVDLYRELRERHHEGPYYSVLNVSAATAKKGSAARAHFDPFHGMASYSGKYQKKKRGIPRLPGRPYVMKFFPRELWQTIQPSFKPDKVFDGYAAQPLRVGAKRGFEEQEDDEPDDAAKRRKAAPGGAAAGAEDEEDVAEGEDDEERDRDLLDGEEEAEEEILDDDFEDDEDEMGGDYNAEQYFDAGDDEFGEDGFQDGGGGGGDEDTY